MIIKWSRVVNVTTCHPLEAIPRTPIKPYKLHKEQMLPLFPWIPLEEGTVKTKFLFLKMTSPPKYLYSYPPILLIVTQEKAKYGNKQTHPFGRCKITIVYRAYEIVVTLQRYNGQIMGWPQLDSLEYLRCFPLHHNKPTETDDVLIILSELTITHSISCKHQQCVNTPSHNY